MKLKKLASALLVASGLFTASAAAQFGGGSVGVSQVNFGGQYNKTTWSGDKNGGSVSNYSIGGSISAGGGYGGGYGGYGGYGGGCGYGIVPVYSPFTRCYGVPYYPAVVLPYYGGPCVPVYPIYNGQFIVR